MSRCTLFESKIEEIETQCYDYAPLGLAIKK